MSDVKTEYLIIKRNVLCSILEDVVTFGMLGGTVWFNQTYCGASWFLNALILWGFIMMVVSYPKIYYSRFYNLDSAIKHLESLRK